MERTLRSLLAVGILVSIPALAGDEGGKMMAIRMKKGTGYGTFYGDRPIHGVVSPDSDAKVLVLTIPGADGRIRIPRSAVESIVPAETEPAGRPVKEEDDARVIATTHVVVLKNGEKIRGDLVPTRESEPVKIDVDEIGRLSIPRGRVRSIIEEDGEIRVPKAEPVEPPPAPPETAEEPAPGEEVETQPGEKAPPAGRIPAELRERIEEAIHDLTRWRSRDRVRAERQLVDIGPAAIPFLGGVARDPFDLTRRAVLRIIRDIGDPEGIPIAIEALLDEDRFVRETADEALKDLAGIDLGYRVDAPVQKRIDAYRRWVEWWRSRGGDE